VIEEDTQHVRRHEVERIDHAIAKKTQQREKLLARKEKGHFVVRLPYREAAELLAMPEGSVSVAVMRAFEKLREMQKKLTEGK
jgi:DNA-directed RNA polymerase specialized sigma24 family protein